METNFSYTAVGAFVLVLISAIVLAIIWLSSGFTIEHYKTYEIYMQESVSGLNVQSPVEFNGVEVGNVKTIAIDKHNPQLVKLLLEIKEETPITVGTLATLQTRGLTGITFVALKDKSDNLTPLVVREGEQYPIIKTAPSLFVRLDTALSKLTDDLERVSRSINELLDKQNQKSIKEILINFRKISGTIADNDKKIANFIKNLDKAGKQLPQLVNSTSSAMNMLSNQALPATYQIVSHLDNITRSLQVVTSEIEQNPGVLVRGIQREPSGPGEQR